MTEAPEAHVSVSCRLLTEVPEVFASVLCGDFLSVLLKCALRSLPLKQILIGKICRFSAFCQLRRLFKADFHV